MDVISVNVGFDTQWKFFEGDQGMFVKNEEFGQQIRLGNAYDQNHRYDPYDDGVKGFVELADSVQDDVNNDIKIAVQSYDYTLVKTNAVNLNPVLAYEPNLDGTDLVLFTYGKGYKFLRSILGKKCEIINTYRNSDGSHGCMIRVPADYSGAIIKSEAEKGENYFHLNISRVDGNLMVSQNAIKKPETIKTLRDYSEKKKFNGFKVESPRVLTQHILCHESDAEKVNEFIDSALPNEALTEGYKIWAIPDDILTDWANGTIAPGLQDLIDSFKHDRIRAALIWDMQKFPYSLIKKFRFLYVFTVANNGSIKNIRSN